MRWLPRIQFFGRIDDTLGVFHTHYVAGALGGLLTGLLADPAMMEYLGAHGPGSSVTGLFYGNPHQFVVQLLALGVITGYDGLMTWIILKLIGQFVSLRASEPLLLSGDSAVHGESLEDELADARDEDDEMIMATQR
jgi:Amt family ammonium transporter